VSDSASFKAVKDDASLSILALLGRHPRAEKSITSLPAAVKIFAMLLM